MTEPAPLLADEHPFPTPGPILPPYMLSGLRLDSSPALDRALGERDEDGQRVKRIVRCGQWCPHGRRYAVAG